ncbi:MAG: LysR family transcriptional regulator [Halioglobus sp.]
MSYFLFGHRPNAEVLRVKLQQLRYFVAVYEEGSITAGAERAFATQQGLSMQIKDLEERFDAVLFERAAKGVHPTEMGRRFYKYATKILKEVAEAEQGMKAMRGVITGHVNVGLMPTFTRSIFPSAMLAFGEQYPLVDLSVVEAYSAKLIKDVLQGSLDFAIVPGKADDLPAGLRGRAVGKDSEFLVSRWSDDGAHLKPVSLQNYKKLKLILPSTKNVRRTRLDAFLKQNKIEVSAKLELDAMMGTLKLVSQSDWRTIQTGALLTSDRHEGRFCINPLVDAPEVDYVLIEATSRRLSQGAQLFADCLQQEYERQVPADGG